VLLFSFLFGLPVGAWALAVWAMLAIAALAIPIYLSQVLGGVVERRVTRALDERDARRSHSLRP
jgi:uncharacterized membrane protein